MMRVRYTFSGLPGSPYLMTTYWTAATEDATAAAAASDAVQAMLNGLKPQIVSFLSWVGLTDVAVIDPVTGVESAVLSGPVSNAGTGTAAAIAMPEAVQGHLVLSTATVRFGRRVRGGLYIPGVPTGAATTGGQPTTTYLTALATNSAALFDPTLVDLVVWSRPTTVPTPRPGASSLVTAINVTQKFASLRSRRD